MTLTDDLKARARELEFHLVGVTSPAPFAQAETDILRWLEDGHQGDMGWLNAARTRLATRPQELLPGAKSLVVVGVSYRTEEPATQYSVPSPQCSPRSGRIARYAWGGDYHAAMKSRLKELAAWLGGRARVFVDDGPLVERDAAVRAGIGFRGKNTNILTPIGSFVFLGAVLTDVELEFDQPTERDCGSCRLCIDACPTDALDAAYHLAAERCIAYLTIEHRGPIDLALRPQLGDWVFGCDICQEVCPYNTSTKRPRGWPEFQPRDGTRFELGSLLGLDEQAFRERFKGSPIRRGKRRGLVRNAALALGNGGTPEDRPRLERTAADDPDPVVREAAEWAITRPQMAEGQPPADESAEGARQ